MELTAIYIALKSIKNPIDELLNFTRNNLGDQGIEILISAVKNSMSLISLDITSNNISYKGGQFIFKNLMISFFLQKALISNAHNAYKIIQHKSNH